MQDVMIDLETLGVKPDAPIIAIGAVFFDRTTGETGKELEVVIDFSWACENRKVCGDTIRWWLNQADDARASITRGSSSMPSALQRLSGFIKEAGSDVKVWGNGATFDISMLDNAYDQCGIDIPWAFWNVRDCRTIEDVSPLERNSVKREGAHHNALDDAKYQAKYISAMIQAMS